MYDDTNSILHPLKYLLIKQLWYFNNKMLGQYQDPEFKSSDQTSDPRQDLRNTPGGRDNSKPLLVMIIFHRVSQIIYKMYKFQLKNEVQAV